VRGSAARGELPRHGAMPSTAPRRPRSPLFAVRIVQQAFEIVHLLTDENPLQVRERQALARAPPAPPARLLSHRLRARAATAFARFSSTPSSTPGRARTRRALARAALCGGR
jgi:hypothetical protein